MHAITIASTAFLLSFATVACSQDFGAQITSAEEKLRSGDFEDALQRLEPLLKSDELDQPFKDRVRALAADILHSRGVENLRRARITESLADFDRELQLQPGGAAGHWQRGIACYYAGEYEKGARQFELHQTVNPQDVENAVWHFLCVVRAPEGSLEAARKRLFSVTRDPRIPMAQIQQLYSGAMTREEVLRVGDEAGGTAKFYADLYVGLYDEALGRDGESLRLLRIAADNPAARNNYMGDVARVHVTVRTAATSAASQGRRDSGEVARKILFLAGGPSHGYGAHDHWAGCNLLAKSLNEAELGIEAKVHRSGWPRDAEAFDGVDCVVMYGDGGGGHMVNAHLAEMDALTKRGVGIACLHYAVEAPKGPTGDRFLEWIGGYFEMDWSVNPHWTARFKKLPEHPITRGVEPFEINDEWYYHMRFREGMRGVTPILTDLPPAQTLSRPDGSHSGNPEVRTALARGENQHLAWAVERDDGGRGFGFTGGHVHWNWADSDFRKLVLNAIAWCAKVEVPPKGISDRPKTLADMERNRDEEIPADFDREAIRRQYALPPDDVANQ